MRMRMLPTCNQVNYYRMRGCRGAALTLREPATEARVSRIVIGHGESGQTGFQTQVNFYNSDGAETIETFETLDVMSCDSFRYVFKYCYTLLYRLRGCRGATVILWEAGTGEKVARLVIGYEGVVKSEVELNFYCSTASETTLYYHIPDLMTCDSFR